MPADTMIALVSSVAGLLLVGGGMLVGRNTGGRTLTKEIELKAEAEAARAREKEAQDRLSQDREKFEGRISELSLKLHEATKSATAAPWDLEAPPELEELRIKVGKLETQRDEVVAQQVALEKERDELAAANKELQTKLEKGRPSLPAKEELERDAKQNREETERLQHELQKQDARIKELQSAVDKAAIAKELAEQERDEARERKEAADRLIEAVRLRSDGLKQQLKEVQAELETLKKS